MEKFKTLRDVFIKIFIVSFAIMIIACLISFLGYDLIAGMLESTFDIESDDLCQDIIIIFGIWKLIIIQFSLVPAIVFHWMSRTKADN